MWSRQTEPEDGGTLGSEGRRRGDLRIIALLLCVMVALVFATMPVVLVPPALSKLLALAALASTIVAILYREPVFVPHPTHWDQAAVFMAVSILAVLFTDVAAVNAFLETLSVSGVPDSLTVAENARTGL